MPASESVTYPNPVRRKSKIEEGAPGLDADWAGPSEKSGWGGNAMQRRRSFRTYSSITAGRNAGGVGINTPSDCATGDEMPVDPTRLPRAASIAGGKKSSNP